MLHAWGEGGVSEFVEWECGGFIYPTWKAETLSQAVDNEDVVLIDVFDVVGGGDDGAVTVAGVVVAAVEFVHDECRAVCVNWLDLEVFYGEL